MRRTEFRLISEINITPLTDVMLVLLVIFMISAPAILEQGLKMNLPKVDEAVEAESDANQLTILADGSLVLNQTSVLREDLSDRLQGLVPDENARITLTVKADYTVPHGLVVEILDTARLAGIENVLVAGEIVEEGDSPSPVDSPGSDEGGGSS
jgi:biopolymer transport protein ExbD